MIVNGKISFFLLIELVLSKLILIEVANIGGAHLFEQFRAYLLHHTIINAYILGHFLR